MAAALGDLGAALHEQGYKVREVDDFGEVPDLIRRIGKPYLTPLSDPGHNDFTRANAIWLVAESGGEPAFLGCARLEDLGQEPVSRYWRRSLKRAYRPEEGMEIITSARPEVDRAISGRLVYFGDLFASKKHQSSKSIFTLRSFISIGHLAAALKWDPDWIYCFVREQDLMRGAALRYCFSMHFPEPFSWIDPPAPRSNSEWLVALPRSELLPMVRRAVLAAQDRSVFRRSEVRS
jgi:hypothetical protein